MPMCYVRSQAKGHGKGKQIEGKVEQGQHVVVVEDLISTGGSSLHAVRALREAGCNVLGVVAIFTYGLEKENEHFNKNKSHTIPSPTTIRSWKQRRNLASSPKKSKQRCTIGVNS